jgi:hypothetical protein
VYIGETYQQFETRKKEHESKVRLTKQDIKNGKLESAEQRMGRKTVAWQDTVLSVKERLSGKKLKLLRWRRD